MTTTTIPMERAGGIARGRGFYVKSMDVLDSPPDANCITVRVTSERGGNPVVLDMDSHEAIELAQALAAAARRQQEGR